MTTPVEHPAFPPETTSTQTVRGFLLARYDEVEAALEFLDVEVQEIDWAATGLPVTGFAHIDGGYGGEQWYLVADPARVLAEIQAKRRIVELHRATEDGGFYHGSNLGAKAAWDAVAPDEDLNATAACMTCGEWSEYGVPWPCPTLRALASVYADHPDYRAEWAL